jgi:undecaprenyl-diphosphatase
MEQVKYAILGIVQGITEFFPVSSSGHLAIAHRILGVGADLGFDTAVHLGTGLAVVIFYFRELLVYAADAFSSTVRFKGRRNSWDSIGGGRLLLLLVITSLPAAFAGFLLQDKVEAAFSSPWAVSVFLCVTGFVLILASRGREGRITKPAQTTAQVALIVGLSQAIALFPGISRSGMTIAAGLMCGFTAQWAVDYSMSIWAKCRNRDSSKPYYGAFRDSVTKEACRKKKAGSFCNMGIHCRGSEYST